MHLKIWENMLREIFLLPPTFTYIEKFGFNIFPDLKTKQIKFKNTFEKLAFVILTKI